VKFKLSFMLCLAPLSWGQSPPAPFDLIVRSVLPVDSVRAALADMNGDGRPDLITQSDAGYSIRLNDGTGSFQANSPLYPFSKIDIAPTPNPFNLLLAADFDNDGRVDLASVTNQGIFLYKGDGKGGLSPGKPTSIKNYGRPLNAVTADFNGDGIPDIAMGVSNTGGVRVFLGTGTGDFQELPNAFIGTVPGATNPGLQVADVNKDGKPDLILLDVLPRTIAILLNDGTGRFKVSQVIQRGLYDRPQALAFGYLDKDGTPSLVIDYFNVSLNPKIVIQDNFELWKPDAQGKFTQRSTFKTNANLQSNLAIGDVDGDGNPDVIGYMPAGTTVFFGDGTGGFERSVTSANGNGPFVAALDLDGDGKAEIIAANSQTLTVLGSAVRASRVVLTRDPPSPFTYGQVEFLTASVVSTSLLPGFPNGTISLFDGAQLIAVSTLSNGIARFSTRFVPGVHKFHATYSGDAQYGAGTADLTLTEAGAPAAIRALSATGLQVIVTDAIGDPVPGAGVIFTAPLYGPSVTFSGSNIATVITGPDGIATAPRFLPNNYPGSYSIGAVVSGYPSVATTIPLTN